MWPAHAAYIYDQGYADVDRYSRYLQRVEQPGPFYSSFLDWEYARGHVGPTPSPAGSPYLGGFGHKASPHGAHGPPGWAAPDPRPWEYNHPGEPPRNAQLLRDEPARDVQIHETFLHMMKARNQRKYGKLWSTWHPLHFWRLLFLVFFFFFAIFGSMSFTTTKGDAGSHWQQISQIDWQWDTFSFIMFLFVCAAMLVSRGFGHVVELFLFVFILATALAALAAEDSVSVAIFQNGCDDDDAIFDTVTCPKAYGCRVPIKNDTDLVGVGADEYEDDRGTATPTVYNRSNKLTAGFECEIHNEKPPAQTIVWSIFIALASLVLVQKFFVYVIYKAMIQREWVDVGWLYNRRQVGKNVWTYSAGLWRKEVTVQYKGEVNERGLPHGMGHWTDGDFHGEHLCGLFREGVPVGPFTSAEQGTNFTFTNVRIGIVQCRAEQEWGQKKWTPAHRELQFGIGGVTACTSGIFYTHFPIPQQITPLLTAAQCEVYYRDPDVFPGPKRVASHAHNWFAVFVDQIQHLAGQDMPLSVVVAADPELGLVVEGFHPVQAGAAVQISVEDPPGAAEHDHTEEIRKEKKLVVHNWRWNAAMPYEVMLFLPGFNNSCRTGTAMFSQFLALGDFPPQLKPFIFSWPSGQIATYYKARDSAESVAVAQSFTEFVSMLIHVGFRRFHILTHSMGGRCWCSVYETAKPLFAAIDAPTRESEGKASLMSVTLINPEFPVQQFVESSYHSLRSRCSNITIYGNKADQALMYAELFNDPHTFYKEPSLGKAIDDPGLGALDVDIVDTTFLQNNVHKTKHSYFNINRELVEDLRDLIVTQRRAAYRIRLRRVKLDTNVFVFMVAPPALQNG